MTRGSRVERSAEERELARQERARRRAEREGQPLPPLEEQPPAAQAGAPVEEQPPAPLEQQPPPLEASASTEAATQQWDVLAESEPPPEQPAPAVYEPALAPHEGDQFESAPNVVAHDAHRLDELPQLTAHEPDPTPHHPEVLPEPAAHEPDPTPHNPEVLPESAAHEPDPTPHHPEALPELAAHEPDPTPHHPGVLPELAAHEPDPTPHHPEVLPELAAHEPDPTPHHPEMLPEPPAHEPDPSHYVAEPAALEPHDAALADQSPVEHLPGSPSTEELAAADAEEPPQAAAQSPSSRSPRPRRGARRRAPAGDGGGRLPPLPAAARAPLEPRRRSSSTRIAAVAALVLVVVAAIVVLVASGGSSNGKTASTATTTLVHVVVPEGQTRLQIARTAARVGLTGSYRTASKRSQLLDPTSYGAPSGTPDLEGFLFPASYDLNPRAPAARLVEDQLIAFKENFGSRQIAQASALHITPYQLLVVASMVEREAQVPGDRAKIAAVIYNRLHAGMPLGIDATLYYAIETRRNIPTYTAELTESDLHMNSRYNTRTHVGLPPTPIANPGMASIEAAGKPAHASYLYYVLAADGCGEHVFSTSEAQFQANAAAYQAALRNNGGHPPTCKKK